MVSRARNADFINIMVLWQGRMQSMDYVVVVIGTCVLVKKRTGCGRRVVGRNPKTVNVAVCSRS